MIIAFVIVSIIAIASLAGWRYENYQHGKSLELAMEIQNEAYAEYWDLAKKCDEKDEHIRAIEKGRDEETECYEQQYLSFEDITSAMGEEINNLKSSVAALRIYRDIHLYTCLPDLRSLASVKTDMETAIEQMDDTPVFYSVLSYMG